MKKFRKKFILSLVLVLVFMSASAAFAGIPDKSDSFYVADYADVISKSTEDYIISKNGELESLCGGQIVVVTVDFLDGMDIEDYAYKIFNEWEIGDNDENNGVLLLLAIGEDNYWCMQGKGLESTLTSGDIDDILWYYLEPDFADADYDSGVLSVFNKLYDEVSGIYGGASGSGSNGNSYNNSYNRTSDATIFTIIKWGIILIILITVISIILGSINGRRRRRNPPGGYYSDSYPYDHRRTNGKVYIPVPMHRPRPARPPRPPKPPQRPAQPSRPAASKPSKPSGGFGGFGSSGGGSSNRSGAGRSFSSSGRSFGGGISRGGGGMSRGGGAGRRGR